MPKPVRRVLCDLIVFLINLILLLLCLYWNWKGDKAFGKDEKLNTAPYEDWDKE